MRSGLVVASLPVVLLAVSCMGGSMEDPCGRTPSLEPTPPAGLARLLEGRVFFGHQSVGQNLIEGMTEAARGWNVAGFAPVEGRAAGPDAPRFLHAAIGENDDPLGKIRDFDAIVRSGVGQGVGLAFMKLCYADLRAGADVGAVFAVYRDTLARLAADFPRTTFVHVTVPLERRDTGPKPWLKRLLGRPVRGYEDNDAREAYNDLLRQEYGGSGRLFDLAQLEAAGAATPRALCPGFTDDGGHLNATGRRILGAKLLAFLAGQAR